MIEIKKCTLRKYKDGPRRSSYSLIAHVSSGPSTINQNTTGPIRESLIYTGMVEKVRGDLFIGVYIPLQLLKKRF